MRVNCCGNLDGEPRDMRKWEPDVYYTCCGNLSGKLSGKTCFHDGNGNGNGRKRFSDDGSGNGRLSHTVGIGNNGSENDGGTGRVCICGNRFTMDSRPVPVPSRPSREFPSRFYPCKALQNLRFGGSVTEAENEFRGTIPSSGHGTEQKFKFGGSVAERKVKV